MKLAFISLVLVLSQAALAATNTSSMGRPVREDKKWGVMVGIGSPYPSILGLTVAHNLSNDVRLSFGYGEVEMTTGFSFSGNSIATQTVKGTTYDIGADYLFMQNSFRPLIGLHAAYFDISGEGDLNLMGFTKSGAYAYSNIGFDWISEGGYQIGLGYNLALAGGGSSGGYINTGYYF